MDKILKGSLLLLCVFATTIISAQQHFVKGLVVLNSGNPLSGLIDDRQWKVNPRLIHFKASEDSPLITFTPLTLRSFQIEDGDWYFSFVGEVEASSLLTSELKRNPAFVGVRDTLFIRALIIGPVSLFYSTNGAREHFYVSKNQDSIRELKYKKYLTDKNEIKALPVFRSQLSNLMGDCEEVNIEMMNIPVTYTSHSLMRTVEHYNHCKGGTISYREKKVPWKFKFSLNAGINSTTLTFRSADPFWGRLTFENYSGYTGGIGLNIIIPRDQQRWSIYNEFNLRNFNVEGHTPVNVLIDTTERISVDFVYLKLATMIRFQLPAGKVTPYIHAGMTNGYALKDENKWYHPNGHTENLLDHDRKYEQGLVLGIGVNIFIFNLEGRYEVSNGMTNASGFNSRFKTFTALAGLTF